MSRLNDQVAAALEELADLMALSGGDQFRVRAYQKAARSIAGYPRDIAQLEPAELDAIPNVGPRLAEKIMEFRSKGTIEQLEELRAQVPAGLRNLLTVPGLGPNGPVKSTRSLGSHRFPSYSKRCTTIGCVASKGGGRIPSRTCAGPSRRFRRAGDASS
jgi:DNA polymerase (family 10)